jgi:multidrug resistance efflux pump
MSESFQRVSVSLRADRGVRSLVVLCVAILLAASWISWAFLSRITRFEISDSARLEIDSAVYPVQANTAGEVSGSHLVLGRHVNVGDLLVALNTDRERLALEEEKARLAALQPQLAALRAELQSQTEGKTDERKVLVLSVDSARAQYEEANAQAMLAEEEWSRAMRLRAEGIMSVAEAERARASAQSKRAAAESLKVGVSRLAPELAVRERDREVKAKETLAEITKLEADLRTGAETVRRLQYEIDRRSIGASVSGRLAECASLRPGSHISEGDRLGVILPEGKLQVIAEFRPSAALGKVRAGQAAVLRLQGFPWAQYGIVLTRVSRVADEIRDGKVRVELAVSAPLPSRIPAQHGLPGSVEVEVERVSPATLLLRSAGEVVGAR